MKKPAPQFSTLRFIFVAVVMMVLADHFIFGGERGYIEKVKQDYYAEQAAKEADAEMRGDPVRVSPPDGEAYFEAELPQVDDKPIADIPVLPPAPEMVLPEVTPKPVDEEAALPLPPVIAPGPFKGKAKVAIVIDDLGMDIKRSRRVMDLPAPVTLAFLPYGTKTREFAKIGKEKGHHLIIHTPMQAVDLRQNIGPMGLKANMNGEAFDSSFNKILQSFDGYEGINNHMGSLLTQDEAAMTRLMGMLKAHDLYFLDSRTIGNSVATKAARRAGVPYASRDVFLDHVDSRDFVDKALLQTERMALKRGSAIAIGHPKDATIAGLKAWIPTLAAKGIELVPVSALLVRPVKGGHSLGEAVLPTNINEGNPQSQPAKQAAVPGSPLCESASGGCRGDDNKKEGDDEGVISEPSSPAPDLQLPLPQTQLPAIY